MNIRSLRFRDYGRHNPASARVVKDTPYAPIETSATTEVAEGYRAMDERRAIKTLLLPDRRN